MANGRVEYRCDICGQTDDHPKMHYGPQTFHHDCIPAYVIDDITSETTWVPDPATGQLVMRDRVSLPELPDHAQRILDIRDKALSGTRGDALVAHITTKMDHGQEG